MLTVLFASVGAIGRFTLEKHHPKQCSSGFAFIFWPFEYPMCVLEFYPWSKLKYCLCISIFHQRNLVSSTTSQGVGSTSASWVLGIMKDIVNYCTVIDLGSLAWVLLLRVYLLWWRSGRTVSTMWSLRMKYLARSKRWDRHRAKHKQMVSWVQSRHSTLAAWPFQQQGRDFRRNLGEMRKASPQLWPGK